MISGVVLVRNEAHNIVPCLECFRPLVDQLILIDMVSTDDTVERARPYVDLILSHNLLDNFDAARNIAPSHSQFDWMWFCDADERIPQRTGEMVRQIVREHGDEIAGIIIPFKSYFCGKWMQNCGWLPGYTMPRVLKRGRFKFAEKLHSGVHCDGPIWKVPPDPAIASDHFSYRDISHYVEKFNRYTSTEAADLWAGGAVPDWREAIRAMVGDLHAYYEGNHGVRDGYTGWILSWLAGQYRWMSHAKLIDMPGGRELATTVPAPASLDHVFRYMMRQLQLARRQYDSPHWPICFRTPLFDPSGYAEDGRTLLKAMTLSSQPVVAEELKWNRTCVELPPNDRALLRALTNVGKPPSTISLTNCIPGSPFCQADPEADFNVLRTTFETDRIPTHWHSVIERFDEVWLLSTANSTAFRQSGIAPEKLRIVPPCVDTSVFRPQGKRYRIPKALEKKFLFLSVFEWQYRKGWDVLVRAFSEEFRLDEPVALLLKVGRGSGISLPGIEAAIKAVCRDTASRPAPIDSICILDDALSSLEMAALYRRADAFVLASRGEGWGRPYMEAMACGCPVIGTKGTGSDDFLTDDNSELVETVSQDVPPDAVAEIPVYSGHRWREPDLNCLKAALRRMFESPEKRSRLRKQALTDVQRDLTLEAAGNRIEAVANDIRRKLGPALVTPPTPDQIRLELEGELFASHSFSNVNEQLALKWMANPAVALSLRRKMLHPTLESHHLASELRPYIDREFSGGPQVVVRHMFPPNWTRPKEGRWVHIQPWEFGALPIDWIRPLVEDVDEIWAPSNYVKHVYMASGVSEEKIHVIPWGIDPHVYNPEAPKLHLSAPSDSFKFLFMGGTIYRKGIDLVLQAFFEEFRPDEPVNLVIKDVGVTTFYRHGNYRAHILQWVHEKRRPTLFYLDQNMTDGLRASLYTACDCLVAPYRGEGFGLPILEAMACGVPAIVPQGGPSDDFVAPSEGFVLPSWQTETHHDWRLRGAATEIQVSLADLRCAMRTAFDGRQSTKEKGKAAAERVRSQFTWQQTVDQMTKRLKAIVEMPATIPSTIPSQATSMLLPELDITVCGVVHNAENYLGDYLASLRPFVREIVLIDVGSSDRTHAIAQEYGVRLFVGPWQDDLSAIRNWALSRATSSWILRLDPPETISEADFRQLAKVLQNTDLSTFGFKMNVELPHRVTKAAEVRLFRNDNSVFYTRRACEDVAPSILARDGRIEKTSINVQGVGEAVPRPAILRQLLHLQLADKGDDFEVLKAMGDLHFAEENPFHAECYYSQALVAGNCDQAGVPHLLTRLSECCTRMGDPFRAEEFRARFRSNGNGHK